MNIRDLHRTDLCNTEFRTLFFQLLQAPVLDEDLALECFERRRDLVITFVGTDDQDMPIATVSLVLERKFIRGGMLYGHIEDVNVSPEHRHEGLGTEIMKHAMLFAKRYCGRVVLECSLHLQLFYETHGFKVHSIAMKQIGDNNRALNPSTDNPSTER